MNAESKVVEPTQNDRIMAALAHVTAVIPVTGIIAPILIWVTQREKSDYVAFQALQAVAYQLSMIVAWFAGMALYMASFFIAIPFSNSSRGFPVFMLFPFGIMGLMLAGGLLFVVYGIVAAVMVLQGRNFRYVIIGNALRHYLQLK